MKCALCARLEAGQVWEFPLCYAHVAQWHRDFPGLEALVPNGHELEPGEEARLLAMWTRGWVTENKRKTRPIGPVSAGGGS